MNSPIIRPSTDFGAVRDGRNAPDFYFDIDLTVAGELVVPIAGNSFYCDADPSNGNAIVHFQDTNLDRTPTPFYISPGFIARIPFTQCRFVWSAQPGKKIRVIYGTDTDFQPGSVSQVTFAGNVNINGATYNASFIQNSIAVGANQIIAPGANVNGVILSNLNISYNITAGGAASILAKSTPPASITDGDAIGCTILTSPGPSAIFEYQLINPVFIPPGRGLYLYTIAGSVFSSQQIVTATWQQ